MSGFPNIPDRLAFGPDPMRNKVAPVTPETDLGADQMNLTFWQAAGAGRVLPQAVLLLDPSGPTMLFQALAFDPKAKLQPIPVVINGVGDYTFTFASTYQDQRGQDTPFTPRAALAMAQNPVDPTTRCNVALSGQDVNVRVRHTQVTDVDAVVMLAVW